MQCYALCPPEVAAARNAERPAAARVPDDAFRRMAQVPTCFRCHKSLPEYHMTIPDKRLRCTTCIGCMSCSGFRVAYAQRM